MVTQTNFFPQIPQTGKILEDLFLLLPATNADLESVNFNQKHNNTFPDLLVSMTYGRLVPFLTKPLETSTSEAITVVEAEAG